MLIDTMTVDARKSLSSVTISIRVKGFGVARARLWFAGKIMCFAGFVAGCKCEVTTDFDS